MPSWGRKAADGRHFDDLAAKMIMAKSQSRKMNTFRLMLASDVLMV